MKKIFSSSVAFTLAEILIVLGIIGVVAGMTIPNLVTSYRKDQTVTLLKQGYGILSSALESAKFDNGCKFSDLFDYFSDSTTVASREDITSNFVHSYITPYVKVSKDCGFSRTGDCSFNYKLLNGGGSISSSLELFDNFAERNDV